MRQAITLKSKNQSPHKSDAADKHRLVENYVQQFGDKYLESRIFQEYPEAKILPAYIREHFSQAELVLDLGFGAGLWFWASFLPALVRIDGFDVYPEALQSADRVFVSEQVPEGYRLAHGLLGKELSRRDLEALKQKRGYLVIQDYREPWPEEIKGTRYDLVTEHGGGLGEMRSDQEFVEVVKKSSEVLRPSGSILFANFLFKERSLLARRLGKHTPRGLNLNTELFDEAVRAAGMVMMDFHAIQSPADMPRVQTFFYGYAIKPH